MNNSKELRWNYGQKIRVMLKEKGIHNEVDISRITNMVCDYNNYLTWYYVGREPNIDFENREALSRLIDASIEAYSFNQKLASYAKNYVDYGKNMYDRWTK